MHSRIIDLNCSQNEYKFNISAIKEEEWVDMAHEIVLAKGENVKELELTGCKVVIRDNKAKFQVFFQDSSYHEHAYHLDVFGRASREYKDLVSLLFQDTMINYYGEEYQTDLEEKIDQTNQTVQQ